METPRAARRAQLRNGHEPGEMASEQHEEQQRQHVMNPEIVSW